MIFEFFKFSTPSGPIPVILPPEAMKMNKLTQNVVRQSLAHGILAFNFPYIQHALHYVSMTSLLGSRLVIK